MSQGWDPSAQDMGFTSMSGSWCGGHSYKRERLRGGSCGNGIGKDKCRPVSLELTN